MYFINQSEIPLNRLRGYTNSKIAIPLTEVIKHDGTLDWFELDSVNQTYKESLLLDESEFDLKSACERFNLELKDSATVPITETRVQQGFKAGLVDYGLGAIIKVGDKWFDKNNEVEIKSEQDALSYVSKYTSIIPCLYQHDIEQMDQSGVITLNGDVVATRSKEEGELVETWKLHKTGRQLTGEALRVLHHLDYPLAIMNSAAHADLYHGTLTDKESMSKFDSKPMTTSMRGSGLYTTRSINEAVTVYANPKSFEVSMKREGASDEEKARMKSENGLLLKLRVSGSNCFYNADFNRDSGFKTLGDMPSPHAIEALCNSFKTNNPSTDKMLENTAKRTVSKLFNARTHYDCYVVMNELNTELGKLNQKEFRRSGGALSRLISSMGYDAINIVPPKPEQIQHIRDLIDDVDRPRSEVNETITDLSITPKAMKTYLDNHLKAICSSVAPKMEMGHTLFFDQDKLPVITESIKLPKHTAIYTDEVPHPVKGYSDEFYSFDNKDENRFNTMNINLVRTVREAQFKNPQIKAEHSINANRPRI
ncbi:hypothetical protein [Vibrio sp. D431a]|uniref:hypothetical protein n=1 Tax=Vibrio sp. D431a TaxID=2837388 RepID=UPI00255718DD|nr:hypothetical protein [Vibrio sp. D431a]MDK9789886.1 hypothetical protein [Vibrio sp. D431a]